MKTIARLVAPVFALGLLAACSANVDEGSTGRAQQALPSGGVNDPPGPPDDDPPARGHGRHDKPPPATFPPANAVYCPNVNPACSLVGRYTDPAWRALGCSDVVHYKNGQRAGLKGGYVTLCPDTPAVRAAAPMFAEDVCDACLPVAPPGEIYVVILAESGPNCPTSCPIGRIGQAPT